MICMPEAFIWMKNADWYDYDENDYPYLTERATEEAKKSFELWKELQKMKAKHPERMY